MSRRMELVALRQLRRKLQLLYHDGAVLRSLQVFPLPERNMQDILVSAS